eukprot:1115799-Rhodomonas_salina.1
MNVETASLGSGGTGPRSGTPTVPHLGTPTVTKPRQSVCDVDSLGAVLQRMGHTMTAMHTCSFVQPHIDESGHPTRRCKHSSFSFCTLCSVLVRAPDFETGQDSRNC